VELRQAAQAGPPRPGYVTFRHELGDSDADIWFSHFSGISTSAAGTPAAGSWAPGPLGLVFQRNRLLGSGRLEHQPEALYPDLAQVGVQTVLDDGRPALRLTAAHPYAEGFCADGAELPDGILHLDLTPGQHEQEIAARTRYATLPGRPLRYRVEL
jgi:hypothetical protein